MATRHALPAQKREVFGKQLNKFRKEGKVPGNLYGKVTEPTALWFNAKDISVLLKDVSETALIDIVIDGEKPRPAVIRDVQHAIKHSTILHFDAQQVNMKEKIQVAVAIEVTGESEAVSNNTGILEAAVSEIDVEALPSDLPESFSVDVSTLKEVGDKITVADLKVPHGVEVITDKETVLAVIIEPQSQEEEEVAAPNEAEAVAAVETESSETANEEKSE